MTALSQDLLIAADRYGLDRLKVMCERRLALAMDANTVASMLVLADQRNCSRLKAKCIDFIARGSMEIFDAVLVTEGYKNLEASSPLVLTELLKAARGKKSARSCPTHYGQFGSTQAATPQSTHHEAHLHSAQRGRPICVSTKDR
jgi:speckle-type POZ protein